MFLIRLRQSVAAAGSAGAALATAAPLVATAAATRVNAAPAGSCRPMPRTKRDPLTVNDKVVAGQEDIRRQVPQVPRPASGLGDGPDADPERRGNEPHEPEAGENAMPTGSVFYKVIATAGAKPKMPAFKDELNEPNWSVVAYVQSLRKQWLAQCEIARAELAPFLMRPRHSGVRTAARS